MKKAGKNKLNLFLVLLIAIALRIIGVSTRTIWYDEAFSLLISTRPFTDMLHATLSKTVTGSVADIHPIGYYFIFGKVIQLFGNSIVVGHLFSILISIAILFLLFHLVQEFVETQKIWIVMFFLSISPFFVHYSQEIRMYVLMALALVTATYALFRGMKESAILWWVVFAVSAALAQYTHNLSAIYLIVLASIPAWRRDWRSIRNVLLSGLGAIILYLPWIIPLFSQVGNMNNYWVERPTLDRFITLILAYIAGIPLEGNLLLLGLFASVLVLVFGILAGLKIGRGKDDEAFSGGWLFYLGLVPPIVLWLLSQWKPVYIERALLTSSIMFVMGVGWIITHPKTAKGTRVILASGLILGAVIGNWVHWTYDGFPYGPWEQIGAYFQDELEEGEIVVHSNKLTFMPMYYYFKDTFSQEFIADAENSSTDTLAPETQDVLGIKESENIEDLIENEEGVWFVVFRKEIEEYQESGIVEMPRLEFLREQFSGEELTVWDEILVYHFY